MPVSHTAVHLARAQRGWTLRVVGSLTPPLLQDLRHRYATYSPLCLDLRRAAVCAEVLPELRHFCAEPTHTVIPTELRAAILPIPDGLPVDMRTLLTHELRSPLALSQMRLSGLLQELVASGSPQAESCRRTIEDLQAVRRLLDTYLSAHRTWESEAIELSALCRQAVQHLQDLPGAVGLTLHTSAEAVWVWGDRQALYQLVWNLLLNALEAGGPPDQVRMSVRIREAYGEVLVTDAGPGFPPERLQQPSLLGHSTKAGGLGVGLAICDWITRRHRGQLHLENGAVGARARVLLPLHQPH